MDQLFSITQIKSGPQPQQRKNGSSDSQSNNRKKPGELTKETPAVDEELSVATMDEITVIVNAMNECVKIHDLHFEITTDVSESDFAVGLYEQDSDKAILILTVAEVKKISNDELNVDDLRNTVSGMLLSQFV